MLGADLLLSADMPPGVAKADVLGMLDAVYTGEHSADLAVAFTELAERYRAMGAVGRHRADAADGYADALLAAMPTGGLQ